MKIVTENLTKTFKSRNKNNPADVIAVNNFSLEVESGKLIGLLGPSGCGKSTLLYLLSGLEEASGGRILFDGEDVTKLPPEKRGIGLVFQNYALYPHMTVRQNILFPLQNLKGKNKLTKEEQKKRVLDAARLVQIEEYLDRKPSELSGGQQQRVAIARALVKLPNVLLLDEPLSNLDARLRIQTREEIKRLQNETKITTIFVTHDQDEAMSISDIIAVMKNGMLQQVGKPQDVYNFPVNLFVAKFLGIPPINVFEGEVADGMLYIGTDRIFALEGVKDGKVYVGIRPEGLIPDKTGELTCRLKSIEVMGRDISIVAVNEAAETETIRAIVASESDINPSEENIIFSIKPNKLYIFDKETEERIEYTVTK